MAFKDLRSTLKYDTDNSADDDLSRSAAHTFTPPTKAEFIDRLTRESDGIVNIAVRQIYLQLTDKWDGHRACVAVHKIDSKSLTPVQYARVVAILTTLGWSVKYVSDQRDGDYLEIT